MIKIKPHFIVGSEKNPYLLRWYVIPRNRFFNIYLHKFCRSDDDRALRDHPWRWNLSFLLWGAYAEHLTDGIIKIRRAWLSLPIFRLGATPHRIQLFKKIKCWPMGYSVMCEDLGEKPVWTLFVTGDKNREWGFHCPKGWKHWKDFVSVREGGNDVGAGCDD